MNISIEKIFGKINNPPVTFSKNLKGAGGEIFFVEKKILQEKILYFLNLNNWKKIAISDISLKKLLDNENFELIENPKNFQYADVGINFCKYAAANTGSIIITSNNKEKFRMNIIVPNLIFICNKNQIVEDIQSAIKKLKKAGNFPKILTAITGPSRTADIEKTLIMGMHGPKRLITFILNL